MNAPSPRLTEEQKRLLTRSTVVPRLASELASRFLDVDSLRSIGNEAEFQVAARFDATRGVPFEGFTYGPVRQRMRRELRKAQKRSESETPGYLGPAYDSLEHARDEGNVLLDSDAESRRQITDHVSGMLGAMLTHWLSASSVAPTDDEIHDHIDAPVRRQKLLAALDSMGEAGRVLTLRHLEQRSWDDVGVALGVDERQARRMHETACKALVRLLAKRAR